ncbi:MAG: hypothetical protein K940chlam9_01226 [Chlamydiae bacterium]|nr:hypothetical protein [Chlamydiota bacterium]
MLHLFRKYQKYIFLFTTVIIVTSFVFFGTYRAFAPSGLHQEAKGPVVLGTLDGKKISQARFEQMSQFLSSEGWLGGGKRPFAGNFLNDGIISGELLGVYSGFGATLPEEAREELSSRLEREKNYELYQHPHNSAISLRNLYSLFAPELLEKLQALQESDDPIESFGARVDLLLGQQNLPPSYVTQVLRYQERENGKIPADPRLMKDEITLFGYRDMTDWFGEAFVEYATKIVFQTAAMARQQGYTVSYAEVWSDLLYQSEQAFDSIRGRPNLAISSGGELLYLYMRQNGLTEDSLTALWNEILLFKRLLHDVGDASIVDTLPMEEFYSYAHENATVALYQMSEEFRFHTLADLQEFESYLEGVGEVRTSPLDLPSQSAPIATVEAIAPELVGRRYRLYVTEVAPEVLQARVGIKETWEWELDPQNWALLENEFPELAEKKGSHFEILEGLPSKRRTALDAFTRKQIAEKHPEWISERFQEGQMEEHDLFLSATSTLPFAGLSNPAAFLALIEKEDEITGYTQDGVYHYRILVADREDEKEVLTYKEAKRMGVLKTLSERLDGVMLANRVIEALSSLELKDQGHYAPHRFASYLEAHATKAPEGDLAKQWKVVRKETTLTRSAPSFLSLERALQATPETLSEVAVDEKEGAYRFQFLEKKHDTTIPLQKVLQAQALLSQESRGHFLEALIPLI